MLKYLITGTENLIGTAALIGMLFAYTYVAYGSRGRRVLTGGSLLGFLAACVMSYLKNKTKLIDTGRWNIRIFAAALAALLLFLIFDAVGRRKRMDGIPGRIAVLAAAVLAFTKLFYALPDVLAYPYNFILGGEALLSTGFLYRLIGLILGVILVIVAGLAIQFVGRKLPPALLSVLLKLGLLVNASQQVTKILQTLYTRRIISGRTLFRIVKFTSNHSQLFVFLILLVAAIAPVVMWIRSFHANEPYENPAQHRKIRANWRSVRRWSTTALVCFALSVLNITAVKAYANRPVELSPVEECEVRGDNVYVTFEQVEDGHLHRFAYETPKGISVRFIIIKKPNSSSYGVGMDACDICGETGYFERNGQVVCKLCDVVMNVNTIGFKGGCNPKVVEYSIENGNIIIPTAALIAYEGDFKK